MRWLDRCNGMLEHKRLMFIRFYKHGKGIVSDNLAFHVDPVTQKESQRFLPFNGCGQDDILVLAAHRAGFQGCPESSNRIRTLEKF